MLLQNVASLLTCAAVVVLVVILMGCIRRLQSAVCLLEMQSADHGHTIYAVHGYRVERLNKRFHALRDELFERSAEGRQDLVTQGRSIVDLENRSSAHRDVINSHADFLASHGAALAALKKAREDEVIVRNDLVDTLARRVFDLGGAHGINVQTMALQDAQIGNLATRLEALEKSRPAPEPCCLGLIAAGAEVAQAGHHGTAPMNLGEAIVGGWRDEFARLERDGK